MSPENVRAAAKKGDLSALSVLIQQEFTTFKVHVNAEIQFGVTLWLKLKTDETLDSQVCLDVILGVLNSLKLETITSVRISETSYKNSKLTIWDKYLALKQGKFVDNTKTINQMTYAVCSLVALGLIFVFTAPHVSPPSTTAASSTPISSSTDSRVFLGKSQTGYELWADGNCVYVKGITEADLARLNTDVWGFKEAVKAETGYSCVLFE